MAPKKQKESSRELKKFTAEQLSNALAAVRNGCTMYAASKTYQVPRTTLYRRINSKDNSNIRKGPPTVLSTEQEKHLVDWILHVAKMGFPVTHSQLCDSVKQILQDIKIPTPFKDGRPGKKFLMPSQ